MIQLLSHPTQSLSGNHWYVCRLNNLANLNKLARFNNVCLQTSHLRRQDNPEHVLDGRLGDFLQETRSRIPDVHRSRRGHRKFNNDFFLRHQPIQPSVWPKLPKNPHFDK